MLLGVLGAMEIAIIVVVILLIFGPSKLPQLGSGIGKMLRGFKKEMRALEDEKQAAASEEAKEGEAIDVTPTAPEKPKD